MSLGSGRRRWSIRKFGFLCETYEEEDVYEKMEGGIRACEELCADAGAKEYWSEEEEKNGVSSWAGGEAMSVGLQ